jgi:aspartate/methionine/tyrosine aminotransferase
MISTQDSKRLSTSKRLEGIGEYYFSQKLREIEGLNKAGKRIINLGIGSPDLPPHPDVISTLQEAVARPDVHGYQGYKGSPVLRKAIADFYRNWYRVDVDAETEILPLIGSKEGIMHICMTYLNAGDEVLIPDPGYPTYSSAVQLAGGKCIGYALKAMNNWEPDFAALESRDLSKVKLMWVNYPHMPTGRKASSALFEQLIAFGTRNNILICHDNPYSFILNDSPESILHVSGAKEIAIELNSASKSLNMAGWRIGMIVAAKERIEEILRFKSNMDSGMFLPVQLAAAKGLALGADWYKELNETYSRRREVVYDILQALHCPFDKTQAGLFMWAEVEGAYADGYALSDHILYEKNVFITPGGIFGVNGKGYIRISLCQKEEVLKEALQRIQS